MRPASFPSQQVTAAADCLIVHRIGLRRRLLLLLQLLGTQYRARLEAGCLHVQVGVSRWKPHMLLCHPGRAASSASSLQGSRRRSERLWFWVWSQTPRMRSCSLAYRL